MDAQRRFKARLQGQISAAAARKAGERAAFLAEGRAIRAALARDRAVLAGVKAAKLAELEAEGIPGKYQSHLLRLSPGQAPLG